ncbi:MAG: oxidoreductase [Treponema sp.]|nr:MAG: oxidoreductase [Treponema sp.]
MFDIIVVGAGPAGTTFARLANKNLKILVIDKNNNFEKCCGGLIAPDAQKMLAKFDIGIPKTIISDPQLFYVRAIDLKTNREQNYQRHYTNINRKLLDRYFIEKMPTNVEFKSKCRYISHKQHKDFVTVSVIDNDNSKKTEYVCKLLVGADGASSLIRKKLYNDFDKIRKYISIQGEYKLNKPINHFAVFFDKSINNFYSWLIPKGDHVLIGGAFNPKHKPNSKYRILLKKVKELGYDFESETKDSEKLNACFLIRPGVKDIRTGKGRIVLIGEAAGFISPSSSEGYSYAYKSALALANSITDIINFKTKKYKHATNGIYLRILLKNIKGFFMYNSIIRNIIFKFGIGSIK